MDSPKHEELIAQSRRNRTRRSIRLWIWRLSLLTIGIGIWEFVSGRMIDAFWISKPSLILSALVKQIENGDLFFHLGFTLQEMAIGLVIGGVLGATVGLLLGRSPFLSELFNPVLVAIYSLPKVALAPLFILWFGIDIASKIALVGIIVFFLVFFNSYTGTREVDARLINTLRVAGATEGEVFRFVILPSAAVWIFTGLRLAVPYALIGAIIAELMAASRGIGYQLQFAAQMFNTSGVFASLFVLMIVALTLNAVLTALERRLLRWKGVSDRPDPQL